MRKTTFGIFLVLLIGCKNFETKKVSSKEILRQQLEHFSWNEVDIYPTFDACEEFTEVPASKKCFENLLTAHIYNEFSKHQIVSTDSINEMLHLYLVISDEGIPRIDSLAIPSKLQQQLPDLKNWIEEGLRSLPRIYPARTRSIPVSTKFILPIKVISE